MGETPPLDELAARKRLVQAKMELHRAEMALYYQQMISPFQKAHDGFERLKHHPIGRVAIAGGLGLLLFMGGRRLGSLKKVAGFVAPMVVPKIRGFIINRAMNWAMAFLRR